MPKALEGAIRPNTKLIWIETPTNPLLKLIDLRAVADVARKRKIMTVADNTFASPYIQRPIEFGFDIVMHSTTKYLNGHSDMVGGAVVVGDNKELREKIAFLHNAVGAIQGPFDSFLALARIEDAGAAHGAALRLGAENRAMAGEASEGEPGVLSRPRQPSAARAGEKPDARLRRHDLGRTQNRSCRRAHLPRTLRGVRAWPKVSAASKA